jgi:hypothetical protein
VVLAQRKKTSKKYKTVKQRRAWATDILKLPIQKNDKGEDGVAIRIQAEGTMKMRSGRRLSSDKIKQTEHGTKDEQDHARSKNRDSMGIQAVDKEGHWANNSSGDCIQK